MSVNGLVVMTPTSIASTGTGNSSSIGANGKVTFSSCQTVSLNGVFSSTYDNYLIVMGVSSAGAQAVNIQLRASGVDDGTAGSYTRQFTLTSAGTSVTGNRFSASAVPFFVSSPDPSPSLNVGYLFGPFLAQPTAGRSVPGWGASGASISDSAFTHNQSVAYDGITFSPTSSSLLTGIVTVYGFNQ